MRTRISLSAGHSFPASARWAAAAAAAASVADSKATKKASPSLSSTCPQCRYEGLTQELTVTGEKPGVAVPEPTEQERGALDVAEQERDGAARRLGHGVQYRARRRSYR
jgi:hypothetical protein